MGKAATQARVYKAQRQSTRLHSARGAQAQQVHCGRLRKLFSEGRHTGPLSNHARRNSPTETFNSIHSVTPFTGPLRSISSQPLCTASLSSISRRGSDWPTSWPMRTLVSLHSPFEGPSGALWCCGEREGSTWASIGPSSLPEWKLVGCVSSCLSFAAQRLCVVGHS